MRTVLTDVQNALVLGRFFQECSHRCRRQAARKGEAIFPCLFHEMRRFYRAAGSGRAPGRKQQGEGLVVAVRMPTRCRRLRERPGPGGCGCRRPASESPRGGGRWSRWGTGRSPVRSHTPVASGQAQMAGPCVIGVAVGDQAAEGAAVRRRPAVRVVRVPMDRQPDLVVGQAGRGLPGAQSVKGRFRVLLDWSCRFHCHHRCGCGLRSATPGVERAVPLLLQNDRRPARPRQGAEPVGRLQHHLQPVPQGRLGAEAPRQGGARQVFQRGAPALVHDPHSRPRGTRRCARNTAVEDFPAPWRNDACKPAGEGRKPTGSGGEVFDDLRVRGADGRRLILITWSAWGRGFRRR